MANIQLDNDSIDSILIRGNRGKVLNWYQKGLNILEKHEKDDDVMLKWIKDAKIKIKYLEDKVGELNQDNIRLTSRLKKTKEEMEFLKIENEQLKIKLDIQEQSKGAVPKPTEGVRRKKTPSTSPNENECPDKHHKKLKGNWISVERKEKTPSPLVRRTSTSLSLTKPGTKQMKQTHLNFTKEPIREPDDPDATFCWELEGGADLKDEPTSPSRFRSTSRSTKKVLNTLQEIPRSEDEISFEPSPKKAQKVSVKQEPESQGMNTAIVGNKVSEREQESMNDTRDSDLIILPTQKSVIYELSDSNDSFRFPLIKVMKSRSLDSIKSDNQEPVLEPVQAPPKNDTKAKVNQYVPGFCRDCIEYYNKILPGGFDRNDPFVVPCRHELGRRLREDTPEGFWNPIFTPTQMD